MVTDDQIFERLHVNAETLVEHSKALADLNGQIIILNKHTEVLEKQVQTVLDRQLQTGDESIKVIHELTINMAVFTQKVEHLTEEMNSRMFNIEEKQSRQDMVVGELRERLGKKLEERWDKIVMQVILTIVGIGVVGLLAYLGLK